MKLTVICLACAFAFVDISQVAEEAAARVRKMEEQMAEHEAEKAKRDAFEKVQDDTDIQPALPVRDAIYTQCDLTGRGVCDIEGNDVEVCRRPGDWAFPVCQFCVRVCVCVCVCVCVFSHNRTYTR